METLRNIFKKLITNYLINDADENIEIHLDIISLHFKDEKVEKQFQGLYNQTISPLNGRMILAGLIMGVLLILWAIGKTKSEEYWVENSLRVFAALFLAVLLIIRQLGLYPLKQEQKIIYPIFFSVFVSAALYMWIWGYIQRYPPGDVKTTATLDEVHNLLIYGSISYLLSNIKHATISAGVYWILASTLYVSAQYFREDGMQIVILNFLTIILAALMLAYRREFYYRRIFLMKKAIDPDFTNADEVQLVFKNLINPTVASYSSLDDFRKMKNGNVSKDKKKQKETKSLFQQFRTNFLLLHDDEALAAEFNRFLTRQSIGQTRLTIWIVALNMIISVIIEKYNHPIGITDIVMRAVVIPSLLTSYAMCRVIIASRPYGYKILRYYGVIVVLGCLSVYLAGSLLRIKDTTAYSIDPTYIVGIANILLISSTVFGFRFYVLFPIAISYLFTSLALQYFFHYADNGYIIGCNATGLLTCLFINHYEKILFVYFSLKSKVASVSAINSIPA